MLYKRKMRSFIVAVCLASLLQLAVGEYVWVNGEWVWKEDAKARIVIIFLYLANVINLITSVLVWLLRHGTPRAMTVLFWIRSQPLKSF